MALSFPLPLAQFFSNLPITEGKPYLGTAAVTSRTRGGAQLRAQIGERLWQGSARLAARYHGDADAISARLALLEEAQGSLLVSVRRQAGPGPIADPSGARLGGAEPKLHSVAANNVELRLNGLPPGYELRDGDYLSFNYGSPVRWAFHQIVVGGIADGTGQTPLMQVVPHIRPGYVTGAAVQLVQPVFKAVLVSASHGNRVKLVDTGLGFDYIQTLG